LHTPHFNLVSKGLFSFQNDDRARPTKTYFPMIVSVYILNNELERLTGSLVQIFWRGFFKFISRLYGQR
jgi:hypothetical protein